MYLPKIYPVVLFAFLAGCGEEYEANEKLKTFERVMEQKKKAIPAAEDAVRNAQERVLAAGHDLSVARANRDFHEIAKKGTAGKSEQLLALKNQMQNPMYQSNLQSQLNYAEQQLENAQHRLESSEKSLEKAKQELKDAEQNYYRQFTVVWELSSPKK